MGTLQDCWLPGASWLEEEEIIGTQRMRTQTPKNTKMQNQSIVSSSLSPTIAVPLSWLFAFHFLCLSFSNVSFLCGFGNLPFNGIFRGHFIAVALESDFK